MKKSNEKSGISKLKLRKLSIVKLNTMHMIKGGGESIDDGSTGIYDPKDFSKQMPDACW
ncbi:hypothetical protein [Aquimarina algiphila]|uniref:hypothetical protein n=1 Tax=Aquimarina algiphila TaxID=2047982 RepID=UPI00232D6270|nr:hypothetical protein [Aquimarina algiphila]